MPDPVVDDEYMRRLQADDDWGQGEYVPPRAETPLPPVVDRYQETQEPPVAGPRDDPEYIARRQADYQRNAQILREAGYTPESFQRRFERDDQGPYPRVTTEYDNIQQPAPPRVAIEYPDGRRVDGPPGWQQRQRMFTQQGYQPPQQREEGPPRDRFELELIRAMRTGTPEQRRAAEHAYMDMNLQRVRLTQTEQQRMNRMREAISYIQGNQAYTPQEQANMITHIQTGLDPLVMREHQQRTLTSQLQGQQIQEEIKQRAITAQRTNEFFAQNPQGTVRRYADPVTGRPIGFGIPNHNGDITFVPHQNGEETQGSGGRGAGQRPVDREAIQRGVASNLREAYRDRLPNEQLSPEAFLNEVDRLTEIRYRRALEDHARDENTRFQRSPEGRRFEQQRQNIPGGTGPLQRPSSPQSQQQGPSNILNQIQELRTVATALPENHPALPALQQMEAAVANGNREAAVAILRTLPPEVQSRLVSPEVFRQMNPPQAQMNRPDRSDIPSPPPPRPAILERVNQSLRQSEDLARSSGGRDSGILGIPSNPLGAINDTMNGSRRAEIERETMNAATLREIRELLSQELTPARRERLRIAAMSLQPREVRAGAEHPVSAMINDLLRR